MRFAHEPFASRCDDHVRDGKNRTVRDDGGHQLGRDLHRARTVSILCSCGSDVDTERRFRPFKAEVWLPSAGQVEWEFVGLGNGGLTGGIRHASMVRPLWSGYAVTNSDLGHPG